MKSKRNHKKRHATGREKSKHARLAHAYRMRLEEAEKARRRLWRSAMHLYFSGQCGDISSAIQASKGLLK
jgi:hypothetical protein